MNEVARIIEIYEKNGIDGLLASPSIPDDIRKISTKMDTLDDATKTKVEAILREVLMGTDERITKIENEIIKEQQNLRQSQDNADACIAYLNSAQTGEKE